MWPEVPSRGDLLAVLESLPEWFRMVAKQGEEAVELVHPSSHVESCPRKGISRKAGKRRPCFCAFEVCCYLHLTSGEAAGACSDAACDADDSDEDASVEQDEGWWSWADGGRGCDAEAFVERFAGWSGNPVP